MAAQLAISAHILSVVIWVGGMFFAYMAMRPAAASVLEPPKRLSLWLPTFKRFFPLGLASHYYHFSVRLFYYFWCLSRLC